MDRGDIHLYQASLLPPPPPSPHYAELIIQHVSNICRAARSRTSGKQFSNKWPFLLQVISCLLPLLKDWTPFSFAQAVKILSTFL